VGGAALAAHVAHLDRRSLWVDEVFSLAMATGHSLEHPAAAAAPERGDFVEAPAPQPAAAFRRYAEHESPIAGPARVLRAVLLSDTSPPLYYLLLYAWTLAVGTGDTALRGFTLLWVALSLPLAWSLGTTIGGRRTALPSLALFALAPLGVYFAGEGRMYSLLAFLAMATAWLTLRLADRGFRRVHLALWVAASAAGLLTHYFYVFPWAAMTLWLLFRRSGLERRVLLGAIAVVGLLVLPWYAQVPASLRAWRVTQGWLTARPADYHAVLAPFRSLLAFVSGRGATGDAAEGDYEAVLLASLALAALFWRLGWRRAVAGRRGLAWVWLGAALLGPLLFDLWRGTYASHQARYAFAGLPAALLVIAAGIGSLPRRGGAALLAVIVLAWLPGVWRIVTSDARIASPIREAARAVSARAGPGDVVVAHSIPSGVVGLARYLDGAVPMAAWVGQLGQRRVPDDVVRLAAGRRRLFLVLFHTAGDRAPEWDYLRARALLVGEARLGGIGIFEYAPPAGEAFPR
jgi:uncharacterized membrane protein